LHRFDLIGPKEYSHAIDVAIIILLLTPFFNRFIHLSNRSYHFSLISQPVPPPQIQPAPLILTQPLHLSSLPKVVMNRHDVADEYAMLNFFFNTENEDLLNTLIRSLVISNERKMGALYIQNHDPL
jgi:hypothetical protein